jgi:hypothetical protein
MIHSKVQLNKLVKSILFSVLYVKTPGGLKVLSLITLLGAGQVGEAWKRL